MRLRSALLAPRARRGTRWPRACAEPHAPPPPPPTADSGPVSKTAIDLGVQATYEYLRANTREHPALAACRARTAPLSGAQMQTPPEQGALLAFLVELTAARSVLEVRAAVALSLFWMTRLLSSPRPGGARA